MLAAPTISAQCSRSVSSGEAIPIRYFWMTFSITSSKGAVSLRRDRLLFSGRPRKFAMRFSTWRENLWVGIG